MLGAKYHYANKWIKNKWLLLSTENLASKGCLVYNEAKSTRVVSIKQQDKEAFIDLKSMPDFTIHIFLRLFLLHHGCVFSLNSLLIAILWRAVLFIKTISLHNGIRVESKPSIGFCVIIWNEHQTIYFLITDVYFAWINQQLLWRAVIKAISLHNGVKPLKQA